jgi:hypothetical protein
MAFTMSFVIWKLRQLSECLSARQIGLLYLASAERIRKVAPEPCIACLLPEPSLIAVVTHRGVD